MIFGGKISKLKHYGFKDIVKLFFRRAFKIEILKFHYLRLNVVPDEIQKKLEGFPLDVRELSLRDFEQFDERVGQMPKYKIVKSRLEDPSYKAYGVFENGNLVYSTWISTKNISLPLYNKSIALLPNEGVLEDSFCDPKARGKGYHSIMNNYRLLKLSELGKNRVIAIVLNSNIPAMNVQYKCGFEDLGRFYVISLFGIVFSTINKSRYDSK